MKRFTNNIFILLSSAMLLLFGCTGEDSSQMHEALMQAKAQNENFEPFTSDSTMLRVVDYYDAHGTANEQMLAHYLLGCVYRDLGDAPRALECYHDAVSKADTTSADCDYTILSKVYSQEAYIYRKLHMPQYEIQELKTAIEYSLKSSDTISALINYGLIGSCYGQLEQYDSLVQIKEHVASLFDKKGFKEMAATSLGSSVYALLQLGDYKKAKDYMDVYEAKSGYFDNDNNIKPGSEVYYYSKGMYYQLVSKYDSAEYFYRKLLNLSKTANQKIAASQGLCSLYQARNNKDSVAKYALYSYNLNDSAYSQKMLSNVQNLKSVYDYSKNKRLAEIRYKQIQEIKVRNLFLIIVIILGSISLYIIYSNYKRRKNDEIKELIRLRKKDNTNHEKRITELKSQLLKKSKELEEENNKIKSYIEEFEKLDTIKLPTNNEYNLINSDIYNKFLKYDSERSCKPSRQDWDLLFALVESSYPTFNFIIKSKCHLNSTEYIISILTKLGFDLNSILWFTGIKSSSLSKIRKSLLKKIFNVKGEPKDFDSRIRSL